MQREQVDPAALTALLATLPGEIESRLLRKGHGLFVNYHEILGWLTEEQHEVVDAIHRNITPDTVCSELMDVAVTALFGIVSIQQGKLRR